MITARLSLVHRTSVSTAKPSSAAEVIDSNVCSGYSSSPPRWASTSEPVGPDGDAVSDGLSDGLFDGPLDEAVVTDGEVGAEVELLGPGPAVPSGSPRMFQTTTPAATSRTIEIATATIVVRLLVAPRSLPGPVGVGSCQSPGPVTDSSGGSVGVGPDDLPRASFNVSLSTFSSRRVSKLTGFISTACRRAKAANPGGNS